MKRLVYLYELDSVRNSPEEICIGQQTIFEEIVKKGNIVVLTFNQLTDSETFLCAVKNEKTYDQILELLKMGAIRVSRFGKWRTASQYVQGAIERCLSSNKDAFLFSGLPVKCTDTEMLDHLKNSIRYNDITILTDLIEQTEDPQKAEQLRYIARFVKLILTISMEELSINKASIGGGKTFIQFLDQITDYVNDLERSGSEKGKAEEEIQRLLPETMDILNSVRKRLESMPNAKSAIQNRTNWVNELYQLPKSRPVCLAEAVIDLCYNYTVEMSIHNISLHYSPEDISSFQADFWKRLCIYWEQSRNGAHKFHEGDKSEISDLPENNIPWDTAVRIIRGTQKGKKESEKEAFEPVLLEKTAEKERKMWHALLMRNMWKQFLVVLVYILIFCLIDFMMGKLQDEMVMAFTHNAITGGLRVLGIVIWSTIIFGVVGSVVSNIFHLPDILECVKSIWLGLVDFIRIHRSPNGVAYANLKSMD